MVSGAVVEDAAAPAGSSIARDSGIGDREVATVPDTATTRSKGKATAEISSIARDVGIIDRESARVIKSATHNQRFGPRKQSHQRWRGFHQRRC